MTPAEYNSAVNNHSDGLYRFVLKLSRDEELARDLVQDAFEKAWIKREDVAAEKIKSYLFTSVYNAFVDYTRKQKRKHDYEGSILPGASYSPSQPDLNEVLQKALNQLPDVQRSCVLLRDYEGYDYKEIGEILKLSESQVKVYIFRARQHLQKIIGKLEAVL
ncbi:MAG: RNA polymerase sigma factor [Flavobacteriales bacterium]